MKNWIPLLIVFAALAYASLRAPDEMQKPVQLSANETRTANSRDVTNDKQVPKKTAPNPVAKFGGYPCSTDCSDDKAGYAWAERNGISDPDSCTGTTGAFIEGCRVYARKKAGLLP